MSADEQMQHKLQNLLDSADEQALREGRDLPAGVAANALIDPHNAAWKAAAAASKQPQHNSFLLLRLAADAPPSVVMAPGNLPRLFRLSAMAYAYARLHGHATDRFLIATLLEKVDSVNKAVAPNEASIIRFMIDAGFVRRETIPDKRDVWTNAYGSIEHAQLLESKTWLELAAKLDLD